MSTSTTSNLISTFHPSTDELPFIIGPYAKKLKVSLDFDPETDRTQQEFADECDINNIIARFDKTGILDFVNKHQPQYGDVTGLDFLEMQNQIVQAKNMFADLPSRIRDRFSNDPAKFLDFFNDPENAHEAARLGLLAPEKAEAILHPTPALSEPPTPANPVVDKAD